MNSTKSPASDAGNFSKPRLAKFCAPKSLCSAVRALDVPVLSAYKAVANMWQRQADSTVCETGAEGGRANDGDFVDIIFYN